MMRTTLCAGELRTRVVIERKPTSLDAQGWPDFEEGSWITVCERWAKVEHLQGRELDQARAVQADISTRVTMRYDSETKEITPDMRVCVKETGRLMFAVSAKNPNYDNVAIVLDCREKVQ